MDDGFVTLHPDMGGGPIDYDLQSGVNVDKAIYPENAWIRCKKCGQVFNRKRHLKGWETGLTQASTQLNGAVTAGATTLTVDDNSTFTTNATGSITAFAEHGFGTTVTSSGHGLKGGQVIITSTTNYNGTFNIQEVFTDTFVIPKKYVADDATGTWTVPEYLYIFDTGTYATSGDVSSTYTAATGGPRCDKVLYTGKSSTTGFTGCKSVSRSSGVYAHDDDMYVRGEPKAVQGCPQCGTYNYD